MRLLIFVFALSAICGCGSKDSNPPSPQIPNPETIKTLLNVKAGSGGQCINFDNQYMVQEDGVYIKFDMFKLENSSFNAQTYRLNVSESEKMTYQDLLSEINISELSRGNMDAIIQVLIFDHIKKNFNKMIDFAIGGVVADGSVQDKSFKFETSALSKLIQMPDVELPIRYSVDCFTDEKQYTSFHLRIGEWAGRLIFSKNTDNSIDVEIREINDDGTDILVEKDLLITMNAYKKIQNDEKEKELLSLPAAYRTYHNKGLKISLSNMSTLKTNKLRFFAALYNKRTKDYKILVNDVDPLFYRLDYIAVPFSFFEGQKELLENGDWELVVSLTPAKTNGFIFQTEYYYPLDGRNEPINNEFDRPVVLSNRFMKSCLINKSCEHFSIRNDVEKNLGLIYGGGFSQSRFSVQVSVVDFDPEANKHHPLIKCVTPDNTSSCFKEM